MMRSHRSVAYARSNAPTAVGMNSGTTAYLRRHNGVCARLAFLMFLAMLLPSASHSTTLSPLLKARATACQRTWEMLVKRFGDNNAALESAWIRRKSECGGTGLYEFHQAGALEGLGRYRDAIKVLRLALKEKLPYRKAIRIEYLSDRFSEAELSHDSSLERETLGDLKKFTHIHPHDSFALTEQARELTELHHYADAVTYAKKAADMNPTSWPARMWLVVAAAQAHMCHKARRYIMPAMMLRHALMSQAGFMYAVISCFAQMGNFKAAKYALIDLVQRNPSVKTDPTFKRLLKLVIESEKLPAGSDSYRAIK